MEIDYKILENARIRNSTPLSQESLHSFSDSILLPRNDPQRIASIPIQKLLINRQRLHNADSQCKSTRKRIDR